MRRAAKYAVKYIDGQGGRTGGARDKHDAVVVQLRAYGIAGNQQVVVAGVVASPVGIRKRAAVPGVAQAANVTAKLP